MDDANKANKISERVKYFQEMESLSEAMELFADLEEDKEKDLEIKLREEK